MSKKEKDKERERFLREVLMETLVDEDKVFAQCISLALKGQGIKVKAESLHDFPLPEGKEWEWMNRLSYAGIKKGKEGCFILTLATEDQMEVEELVVGTTMLSRYVQEKQEVIRYTKEAPNGVIPMPRLAKQQRIYPLAVMLPSIAGKERQQSGS